MNIRNRQKLYTILVLISMILLFNSIWTMKWVVVNAEDFLGLVSHLTITYWIGLIIITSCSIMAYLDEELKNREIFMIISIVLTMFLFGIGIFSEENARNTYSYSNIAEIRTIQATNKVDIVSIYPLISYRSWPGYHLLSFYIISILNIDIATLIKYIPFLFLLLYILFCFALGSVFEFSLNKSFLLCIIFLSSLFSAHQWYPSPQSLALTIYIYLFFILISNIKDKYFGHVMTIIMYTSIVITHFLTSTILLISMIIQLIYGKITKSSILNINYVMIFSIIFFGWMIYLIPMTFKYGITTFLEQVTNMDFIYWKGTTKFVPTTHIKEIVNFFRLSYAIIFVTMLVACVIKILKNDLPLKNERTIGTCAIWIFGVAPFVFLKYGLEIFERIYGFTLIIVIFVSLLMFSDKKFFVVLMTLLIIIHIPAHYGSESTDMTTTTELKGSEFFAVNAEKYPYVYNFGSFIRYYDPSFTPVHIKGIIWSDKIQDTSFIYNKNYRYIIDSKKTDNFLKYHIGFNPIQNLSTRNLIYNNSQFFIYY